MLKTKYRLLSTALLTAMLLSACAAQEADQELLTDAMLRPETANYETSTVRTEHYQAEFSGTASGISMAETVLTYKNSGAKYVQAHVKSGDRVSAGDTLITFEVQSSKAEKEALELQLRRKQEDYQTGKEAKQKAIDAQKALAATLTSYDKQIADLQAEKLQIEYEQFIYQTERDIKALQQQIKDINARMNDTKLVAPCDGIVTYAVSGTPGNAVTPNRTLVKIVSTDSILLQVENGGENLRYHMPVTVAYGVGDKTKTLTGRVVTANNILPAGLGQARTLIQLDQEVGMDILGRAFGGTLQFQALTQDVGGVLVADKNVLNTAKGSTFVYVLEGDVIHKRYVIARRNTGNTVWILDGVSEGQNLILG